MPGEHVEFYEEQGEAIAKMPSAKPRNLVRSFRRICDHNNLRVIKVHHLRHTTASLLKKLHVPPATRK